jgi:uncharacterized membrane protein YhaH (DUF805 family)
MRSWITNVLDAACAKLSILRTPSSRERFRGPEVHRFRKGRCRAMNRRAGLCLLGLLFPAVASASKEGAGLGEALIAAAIFVMLIMLSTLIAAIAVSSRAFRRAGRSAWAGAIRGLWIGVFVVVVEAALIYAVLFLPDQLQRAQFAQENRVIDEWLLPLEQAPPGQLKAALATVERTRPGLGYASLRLVHEMPGILRVRDAPAPVADIAALREFIARQPGDPSIGELAELTGVVNYMQWGFDVDRSMAACGEPSACNAAYAISLLQVCERTFQRCVDALPAHALSRLVKREEGGLRSLRDKLVVAQLAPGHAREALGLLLVEPARGYYYGFDERIVDLLVPRLREMPQHSLTRDDVAALDAFLREARAGARCGAAVHGRCLSSDGEYQLVNAIAWGTAERSVKLESRASR